MLLLLACATQPTAQEPAVAPQRAGAPAAGQPASQAGGHPGPGTHEGPSAPQGPANAPANAAAFPPPPPAPWPDAAGRCDAGMVKVPGRAGPFCIDAYEVTFSGVAGNRDQGAQFPDGSTRGSVRADPTLVPSVQTTWYQAAAACANAGYHLCTSLEWRDACAGPEGRHYPTPDGKFTLGQCGIGESVNGEPHPAVAGGAFPDCHTPEGVYNLLGNAWEWVDPQRRAADGTPITDKRGAASYTHDAPNCEFNALNSHAPTFDGTISFRCCAPLTPP